MLLRVKIHPGVLLGDGLVDTAILPLPLAAKEAWMSIKAVALDRGPVAVRKKTERTR